MSDATAPSGPDIPHTLKLTRSESHDEYDALAELFLGDDGESESGPPAAAQQHPPVSRGIPDHQFHVELLVLGHLPVRASVWASQYARRVAETSGAPVALLRITGSEASIDLIGADGVALEPASLDVAIQNAKAIAPTWILRVDDLDEPALATVPGIGRLTLLTDPSDASIVAAYRSLKNLSRARAGDAELAVGIVGVPAEEASHAFVRIDDAMRMHSDIQVHEAPFVDRIEPAHAKTLIRADRPSSDLKELVANLHTSTGSDIGAAVPESPRPSPVVREPAGVHAPRTPAPAPQAPARRDDASSLVPHFGDLRPIAARCPDDPDAELALDASGTLHVLRRGPESVERLVAVGAWAQRHASVLSLTLRDGERLNHGAPPVLHLATDSPRDVRHLLEGPVRIHLIARAETRSGEAAWCCVDLN